MSATATKRLCYNQNIIVKKHCLRQPYVMIWIT